MHLMAKNAKQQIFYDKLIFNICYAILIFAFPNSQKNAYFVHY